MNLFHLNYPLDINYMLTIADQYKQKSQSYYDPRYKITVDQWKQFRVENNLFDSIIKELNVSGKPRFYWLAANAHLPTHVDNNTQCSINFILSENPAPVTILGEDYTYRQAVLNTSVEHGVNNNNEERILFKISVFDTSFEETIKLIPEKYKANEQR